MNTFIIAEMSANHCGDFDLAKKRNGLHPKFYEQVLGKKATRDLAFGSPLRMDDVESV